MAGLSQANSGLLLMGSSSHLPLYFFPWLKTSPSVGLVFSCVDLSPSAGMWWEDGEEGEVAPQNGRAILCQLTLTIPPFDHACLMVSFALLGHPKQNTSLGRWRGGRDHYHESPTTKTVQFTCCVQSQDSPFVLFFQSQV